MAKPFHHLSTGWVDGYLVVSFRERKMLDEQQIQQAGEELFELVQEFEGPTIFDFQNVDFVYESMIGKLIVFHRKLANRGGLVFFGVQRSVLERFKMLKLDRLFTIVETREQAIAEFQ